MSPELRQRLDAVHRAAQDTSITLEGLTEYMQLHAKQLCEALEVPYGSLIRTALAIKRLDGADRLQSEHLQEAAQHVIIRPDLETR